MKKIFIAIVFMFAFISMNCNAADDDEKGFNQMLDAGVGYNTHAKSGDFEIGYNFGYQFIPYLHIGVGPIISLAAGSGSTSFSIGGYGKARYTFANMPTKAIPFVEVRGGYAYATGGKKGSPLYGAGVGASINKKIRVGFFANLGTYKETYTYTVTEKIVIEDAYVSFENGVRVNHPAKTTTKTEDMVGTKHKISFTPTLFVTYGL